MGDCTLCGLPTPKPPHASSDIDGEYCCRGCLTVARTIDEQPKDATVDEHFDTGPATADVEGAEAYLDVSGMHCATCEQFLETTATDVAGVRAAEASYTSGMMQVVYDPDQTESAAVAEGVSTYGYDARERTDTSEDDDQQAVGRLLVGGFFGMMTMMWYILFLYPVYLGVGPAGGLVNLSGPAGGYLFANVWVMATVVLGYTGYPLLRGAVVSLRVGHPNMDLLVAVAATTAYVYSTIAMLLGQVDVYFDIAIVVVLAVTIGDYYQERVRRRATSRISAITDERSETARRRTAAGTETIDHSEIDGRDELVVREGEQVPVDGSVVDGTGAVDEALVTGESLPITKGPGDEVIGGGTLVDGGLVVRADEEPTSTADRLVETLWNVQSGVAGPQRLVDRIAAVFVPLVFVLAVLTTAGHLAVGSGTTPALLTGLTVLVVSCPCALGLATPMAVAAGIRDALADGIVITDKGVLETATEIETVAFDKTGTLTTGEMTVRDVVGDEATLAYAAAVEQFATHPVAEAIVAAGDPLDGPVTDFENYPGQGVGATVGNREVLVGGHDLLADRGWTIPSAFEERYRSAPDDTVPSYVGWNGRVQGVVVAGDEFRAEWKSVVDGLTETYRVVVITGDDPGAARMLEEDPAVDEVFAGVPPEAKAAVVERLTATETVAMVGDGSNDAPALAAADVGIAMERGTRLAVDAADVVVTTDSLMPVPSVFETTRGTRRRVRENLGWAFLYNGIAVPLAVAGLLNPLFAAIAMATSSLLVVVNSTRSVN
ncbi:heavy metal translocating P-type ATPase [Haloarcula laminariae]|uniref:heavy metal translocating P-type ATPase n=1 Tax=Haloarcula laminariae TaxID=2961577 RepID=UPI002406CBF2|nr:heavy metal translocating P-type ATPase [Halomicroarcula sp. FL173]